MYRFLLTPRWWTINIFVVLAVPFCLVMGTWQLGRFEDQVDGHREHQEQAEALEDAQAVPLDELLPPTTDTVGEATEVSGVYDSEHELLVPDRAVDGEYGFYVLTPLQRNDGGAAVPVVRGWLPGAAEPAAVPSPPTGTVTVDGVLQAEESPMDVAAPTGLPAGQIGVISAASLINVVPYEVENSWLTVREAAEPMAAVPPVAPSNTGLDAKAFQNLGYTAEWFVFAGFAVFMWYRFFRRDLEAAQDAALGLGGGPSGEAGTADLGGPRPAGPPQPAQPAAAPVPPAEEAGGGHLPESPDRPATDAGGPTRAVDDVAGAATH